MSFLRFLAALAVAGLACVGTSRSIAAPDHPLCARGAAGATAPPDVCAVVDAAGPGAPRALDDPDAYASGRIPERLEGATILLLGEVHDDPAHHRVRAAMILGLENERLKAGKAVPALVAEHIRSDQALALSAFRALDRKSRRGTDGFFAALHWEKSGWPPAPLFAPLFGAALDLDWPIVAGNVSRAAIRDVARKGVSSLPSEEIERLGLAEPLPPLLQSGLIDELEASHCGLVPRSAMAGLADAQRFRDAYMARALLDAADRHGSAVLVAGNGHVRADRGVPYHIRRMSPQTRTASVLFLEVEPGKTAVADYVARDAAGRPLADMIYLTPAVARADPCVEMRKSFRK